MSTSNMRSDMITKGIDRAPHRSLLRAAVLKKKISENHLSRFVIHTLISFQVMFTFRNSVK